jgi:hypothetical protein
MEQQIDRLRQFAWSSYWGYAGLNKQASFVDYGPLTGLVGEGKPDKAKAYREFVESGIARSDKELQAVMRISSKAIGEESFCQRVEEEFQQQLKRVADPGSVAMRRVEAVIDPERILEALAQRYGIAKDEMQQRRRGSEARSLAMQLLCEWGGLSQREVARRMGLKDGSAVSYALAHLRAKASRTPSLRKTMAQIGKQLGISFSYFKT